MASSSKDDEEFSKPRFRLQEIIQCPSNPDLVVPLQSGSYLLSTSQGQIYHFENESIKPLASFGFPVKIAFCNECVVLVSKYGITFRQLLDNHVPLRDLSFVSSNENQCFVEISKQEASIWASELKDDMFYPNVTQFAQRCQQQSDQISDENYLIVEVDDARGMIKDLADLIQHSTSIQCSENPWLSSACVLLDKLRFFVDPYTPYNSLNPPRFADEKSDAEDLVHYSVMNAEAARRLSFYKWHRTDCLYATPKSLAAAGFFHRPTSANTDRVACFACSVCLVNWEVQDDPMQEHSKHGRTCKFIHKTDLQNVPYDVTRSHLPLYKWSKICEKPDLLEMDPTDLIVGHLTPGCIWLSVAHSSTSSKPSIFLFDTTKVVGKPIEILLDLYATCMVDQIGLSNRIGTSGQRRSFDWLSSVENLTENQEPLCQIRAMTTSSSFDECTITLRGEKIVGVLVSSVGVDENQLKSMQNSDEDPKIISTSSPLKRRPFILVHHIVEFPDDNHILAIDYANAWYRAWESSSVQNKIENFYTPNWVNDIPPANYSPIDTLVLYDDKSDSYAEITKETSKAANEEVFYNPMNTTTEKTPDPDHVPIYYNEKKTAAIGIQCIRMPCEFDSSDYHVDHVVSSSDGNLLVAAINRQNDDISSALLVYAWVPMLHLLQEIPVSKIVLQGRNIKAVHVLGKDYFNTTNAKRENALSSESLNDTVCVLFDNGSLCLVDLDFGYCVKVDVGPLKSVSLTSDGEICGLTEENKMIQIEVQHSIPSLNRDVTEELVISLLSAANKSNQMTNFDGCLIERVSQFVSGSQKYTEVEILPNCAWCPSDMKQLALTWNLIKAEPLVRSHHAMITSGSSSLPPTSPSFNLRSNVPTSQQAQLQSNLGLTVQTSHELVEFILHSEKDRNAANPTILTTTTCQQFCVLNKIPYSDLIGLNIDATRTWQIKPKRESSKKSFVFEFSLMFGLNLSHLNLTLGLAGFVRGVSDIQVTIYIPKDTNSSLKDELAELFVNSEQPILAGSSGLAVESYLAMLSSKPYLLDQKFIKCMGPFEVYEFADANAKQATIQLSVVQLLLAAARSHLESNEVVYQKDWMFRSQRFYVHIDVNERRTIQQKTYQTTLHNVQSDHQRRELFQSVGGNKRSRITTSSGGHIPLPYKSASDRKKQQMKSRNGSNRKRFVHVSNLVAETVAISALKPYTSGDDKNSTILCCLEYLSITAFKTVDSGEARTNMQRCLFAMDNHAHIKVLKLAAGLVSEDLPYYRVLIGQQQALDVLSWLLTQWRVSKDINRINALSNAVQEILPDLINNCFVVAPRTIARKMSAILTDLLNLLQQQGNNRLATKFLQEMTTIFQTKRFRFAASLQWLTIVARLIVKNACLQPYNSTSEHLMKAVVNLSKTCTQIVNNTGKIWKSRRSTADSKIDLESLEEIDLYDVPAMLSILIVDPTLIANAQNNAKLSFSTFKNATSNFMVKNEAESASKPLMAWSLDNSIQFEPAGSVAQTKSRAFNSKQSSSTVSSPTEQTKDAKWLNESTALATLYLLDELDENNVKWYEHLGINSLETPSYPTKKALERTANPLIANVRPQPTQTHQHTTLNEQHQNKTMADLLLNKQGKVLLDELCTIQGNQNVHRFLMGSEQMPGLNEMGRLAFTVKSANCQLRILDLNASTLSKITVESTRINNEIANQSIFGFPSSTKTTQSGTSFKIDPKRPAFIPSTSKNLQLTSPESRDDQFQSAAETYFLERQRAIMDKSITTSDKQQSLPQPLTNPFVAFAPTSDESQQLHTGNKTPSTLISFEEDSEQKVTTDGLFDMFEFEMTADDSTLVQQEESDEKKPSIGSISLAERTPVFLMEMENCTSGQLVLIVLDFSHPFLLTDLIVPANEAFSAVSIDGWLDEKQGLTRFAYSTEIENRSLVLNDLTPSSLIRYVRLSFTTRECRRSAITFMPGQFYGTRFFSPWQLYHQSILCNEEDPCANSLQSTLDKQSMDLNELDSLALQLHTRYQSNLAQLKKVLKKQPNVLNAYQLYEKCLSDRILYNNLHSVLLRSQFDMQPVSTIFNPNLSQNATGKDWFGRERPLNLLHATHSWSDASSNELRFASVEFMYLANEIHSLLALNQQSTSIEKIQLNIDTLDLETAVRLFGCFICDTDSKLQATCVGFLFHQGFRSSWWPDFFPAIIKRYFVANSSDSLEDIFVLLAYICDQSVRYYEFHTPIVEKLLLYVQEIVNASSGTTNTTQLSWLLLLLSSSFDIIVPNTKHIDRWSFVSGNPAINYPQAPMPNENFRRYTRKMGSVSMKDQFWPQHYHNAGGFIPASSLINDNFIAEIGHSMFPIPGYQKYGSSSITSTLDHAAIVEMKKLGNEIRQIGKTIDTMLPNNQLSSDDFTPLKKEQKNLASLYTTAQAYISKSPASIHESFVDKVLISGLEKSELLENIKAPLASQEDDFSLNTDESTSLAESIAKKQQQLETTNANNLKNRLNKVRRSLYLLVKQAKSSHFSRSKTNNTSAPRSRRFAIRMQLSQQTVVRTIQDLMKLMCENSAILSVPTQILLFKVCAKLAVHGCRNPISFRQMMESVQMTQNLLAVVIENSNSWVMHALTTFFLDISESENPTSTNQPSTSAMNFDDDASSLLSKKDTDSLSLKESDFFSQPSLDDDLPNTDSKKRRKEENEIAVEDAPSTSAILPMIDDKDMSPMDEDNGCSGSTTTFTTNLDDENDNLCEANSGMNNLSMYSPTLITSGLVNEPSAGSESNSISDERDFHIGLMDDRSEIGESPQYPFSFKLFDKPNESDVDMLILMALFPLKPIEKKNPNYWDNFRNWFLHQILYAVARSRYERGEPLKEIFRWFDYVMGAEMEAANNCKTENAYVKWGVLSLIHANDFIEREFDLNGKRLETEKLPSHSALISGSYFSQFYYIHDGANNPDIDEDPLLDSLDDKFNVVFKKLILSAKGGSEEENVGSFIESLCSIIESRRLAGNLDPPDEPTELNTIFDQTENYMSVDVSDDAANLIAMRGFMPLYKVVFMLTKLRFMQSLIQVRRCVKNLSFAHLPDAAELEISTSKKAAEKGRRKSTKSKHLESDSSSAEKVRTTETILNDRIRYNATMAVNCLNSRACPIQLGFDFSPNLDICISNSQRQLLAERMVVNCHSLHKMAPALQRTVKTSTVYSARTTNSSETCESLIIEAINKLMIDLNVEKANSLPACTNRCGGGQFLLGLVNFFWDYQGNIIATRSQCIETARGFLLNQRAITNLMRFAVEYEHMNEQIWVHLFKILNALDSSPTENTSKETKSYKFTEWIEQSPYFDQFIERFLNSSLGRFNLMSSTRPTYGPAIQNMFGRFVTILFKKITSQTMDNLLSVLTKVIRNSRECGFANFPLEMITELASNFDKMDRVCQCTPSIFAKFMNALMEFTSDFFIEIQRIQRHFPKESLQENQSIIVSDLQQSIPSNVCFSATLSSSNVRDRNMSMNDRLRIHNSNLGSATKNTKNIAFIKRADILENTVRDGEVASKDLFTMILYSFLRIGVRYISQYKPQILKTILQEQPKILSRAIDMCFTFISQASSVDDITAENFKIVTLADAVIHLLLVVSENSMDDADSSRLFIRFVIGQLRNRVNQSKMEVSTETKTTLMELPLPILLLLKSLLSSVNRCQIFVDEDGHSFIADQLQYSLDLVAKWPAQNKFSTITKQIETLVSNITGVEPMNPLLNTNPPSQIQTSSTQNSTTSDPTIACPSSSGFQETTPTSTEKPAFALKYPTVSMQSPASSTNMPPFGPNAPIVSMQIVNIKSTCLNSGDNQPVEELYNFAPVATVRSDNISPAQLSLLNQNIDITSKRNRTPSFTYRFPPKKSWFHLTFVLPYKIVLHEIIVRSPENNTANSPSAIQVELSNDPAQASWQVLSCPVYSDNPNYYRISTASFQQAVTGVKLHFGCPLSNSTMHLSQVQLLGSVSIHSMKFLSDSKMFETQHVYHWVGLFSRLCKRIDTPILEYAPKLIESLIKVYLSEDHQKDEFKKVYELLTLLNQKSKSENTSLVTILVNYLINGSGKICTKAYASISELLYVSCLPTSKTSFHQRFGPESQILSTSNEKAVLRQRELLIGIQRLFTELVRDNLFDEDSWNRRETVNEVAVFVWSAACVLWHNSSDKQLRYETLALCLEIGPSIIPKLTQFVLNLRENALYKASAWLLTAFARISPELLTQIFDHLGLSNCSADEYSIQVMRILGKVCQSRSASKYLIDKRLFSNWINTVIEVVREDQHIRINEVTAIIDCFRELAVIDIVADFFDKNDKIELLFRSLIRYLITNCVSGQNFDKTAYMDHQRLLWAVIGFIKRCLLRVGQRERVAKIISNLLKPSSIAQKGTPLPKAFLNIILKLIIEDEKIMIKLTGVTPNSSVYSYVNSNFEDQIIHPLFGCVQDDREMEVPLQTLCSELLPTKKKSPVTMPAKPITNWVAYDDLSSLGPTFNMLFESSDMDEKEAIPPKEPQPESSKSGVDYPYMYKQFAVQLVSESISAKHSLNNNWSLETVINASKLIKRPEEVENDGYFTLTLQVKTTTTSNILPLVEELPLLNEQLKQFPTSDSTLLCFAKHDGLKYLAAHFGILSKVGKKLDTIATLLKQLPRLKYDMAQNEISCACESIRTSLIKLATKPNVSTDENNYQQVYNALEAPVMNVFSALQLLNSCGIELPESDSPQKAPTQQPKQAPFGSTFTTYNFDVIDGIPAGNTDEEMLSVFDFMSEAASSSSPKTLAKAGKAFTPTTSNAGLLSALPAVDEDWGMIDAQEIGLIPAAIPVPFSANIDIDLTQQYMQGIQTQLASLESQLEKLKSINPALKDENYIFTMPLSATIPAKRSRHGASLTTNQPDLEHIVTALSLFLEIDTYGQTLVEYDLGLAKRLIYMLLGVDPPNVSAINLVIGLVPLLPQLFNGSQSLSTSKDKRSGLSREELKFHLASKLFNAYGGNNAGTIPSFCSRLNEPKTDDTILVPFIVLSRCFENASVSKVGAQKAEQLRRQALDNGTIDVVLTLLSHYSNQRPQKLPIRPSGDFIVTQLINRLFLFMADSQSIVTIFNESKQKQRNNSGKGASFSAPKSLGNQVDSLGSSKSASIAFGGAASSKSKEYWAKGTGFGSGTTSSEFNLLSNISQKKQNEVVVTYLLNVLTNFIKPQGISSTYRSNKGENTTEIELFADEPTPLLNIPSEFFETLKRSCLSANLSTFLMNDSVLDISNHASAYEAVGGLLLAICSSEANVEDIDNENASLSDLIINSTIDTPGSSVYDRLKQLCGCIDVYISKLSKSNEPSTSEANVKQQEENLVDLLKVGVVVIDLMEKRKIRHEIVDEDEKMDEQAQNEIIPDLQGYTTGRSLESVYMEVLKTYQYQTVSFFNSDGTVTLFPYHYSSNASNMAQIGSGKRIRRLAQESASLLNSLPLSLSSSVFVRVAEERLDTMKILITGPADTPYSSGCFEFDVYFPTDYPNVPMMLNLMTTGNRTVRFNPNLYDCGKVCLSILNTWSGRPEERWNSQTSSFLQVLVSIQSLILVPEPFFNEPGFERTKGSPSGDQSSRDYTANIRHQCIRWAMIEQLRKPPAPFSDVIQTHFWLKRDEICLQIEGWIQETKELIKKYPMAKQLPSHLTLMEKQFESLLLEFSKMEAPAGLEYCKSKFVREYMEKKQQS